MLTLLLAPLSGVLAAVCHCEATVVDSVEMAPVPCCAGFERCCYEQNQGQQATPLAADLNQQSRDDFRIAIRQSVQRLPAPAALVALEQKKIHCVDPPGTSVRERSFRQSWLI
jgi:hypothetical protein